MLRTLCTQVHNSPFSDRKTWQAQHSQTNTSVLGSWITVQSFSESHPIQLVCFIILVFVIFFIFWSYCNHKHEIFLCQREVFPSSLRWFSKTTIWTDFLNFKNLLNIFAKHKKCFFLFICSSNDFGLAMIS